MTRRKAQILLVAIIVPVVLSAAFAVYSWRPPSLELVLGVGVGVFIAAFLVALSTGKGGKKKERCIRMKPSRVKASLSSSGRTWKARSTGKRPNVG